MENKQNLPFEKNNRLKTGVKRLGYFFCDHFHLLFRSAPKNHLRIQKLKKLKKENYNNISFASYTSLKRYQKKVRIVSFSLSTTVAMVAAVVAVSTLSNPKETRAAGAPTVNAISPTGGATAGGTPVTISGTNFSFSDSFTSLLLHADDNGNIFTDSSNSAKTVTAFGNATQSATQSKFGGKSMYLNGASDYLSVPNSADFEFGSGNFTVDWWEYRTSSTTGATIISRNSGGYSPFAFGYASGANEVVYMTSNASSWDIASAKSMGAIKLNTWSHLAVVRNGTNFYTFRDGVIVSTWTSSAALASATSALFIGKYASYPMTGYIDELRVSKGIARWTADFSSALPSGAYSKPNVTMGGLQATNILSTNGTTITAQTPAHAAGVTDVVVTNSDGQSATLSNAYTYIAPPTISGVTPSSGSIIGGDTVTISGNDFSGTPAVKFGTANAASVTRVNSTTLSVVTPAHTVGNVDVQVINPDSQSATFTNGFTFLALAPSVTAISPNNGPIAGGTNVTISGSNFSVSTAPNVTFGGIAATNIIAVNSTTITAKTPAHGGGAIDVVVINPDTQSGTLTNGYTYNPIPTVTSVSSTVTNNQNVAGLLINGTNFLSGASVKFQKTGQSDIVCSSVSFNNASQLSCDADFHNVAGGIWDVVVTNPDGQIAVGSGMLTVRDVLVAKYVFIQKPTSLNETEVGTFMVQAQNQTGDAILVDQNTTINLTTSSPTTGYFATDLNENLSTRWDKTTATIPAGQSSVTFYYKDTLKGTHTISANQQNGVPTTATFALPIISKYRLLITGISDPIQAGVPSSVTIQAIDYLGNTTADYNGTVHFTSTDSTASLPANNSISSSQFSTKTFVNGVTMMTQGEQCVTVTDVSDSNITGSQCSISVTPPPAGMAIKLKFITPPQYIPVTTVSTPITVQLQDINNNPGTKAQATTIYLYNTSATGQFSLDGNTNWTSGAFSVTVPQGATSASFFYKDATLGNYMLTAADDAVQGQDLNLTNDTQALSVVAGNAYSFSFNSALTTIQAGATSSALNVSLHDIAGNQVTSAINQPVYISSSDGAQFSLDGSTNWTTKLATTITTGTFAKNFYYRAPTITGGDVITISDADPANGNAGLVDATVNVAVTGSGVAGFTFVTSPVTQIAGQKSATATVQARDVYGNIANTNSNIAVYLYSDNANTVFYDSTNQNTIINHVTIAAGTSNASFVFSQNSNVSAVTISASDNSLTPDGATGIADATQTETITPGSVSKFAFQQSSANAAAAGSQSGQLEVESQNMYGVKIPVLTNTEIYFYTDSTGATKEFSLQNGSNWANVAHATLAAGSDTLGFYYKDTQAGTHTLKVGDDATASVDNGITNASWQLTVAALGPNKLKLLSLPSNLIAGQTSAAITIQLQDQYGNAANAMTDTVVSIASSDSSGYITNDGGGQISTITIGAGSNSAKFHYRNNTAGSQIITIEASGLSSDSQELTVAWGNPAAIKLNVASLNLVAGSPSGAISVEIYNAYDVKVKTASPITINLSSGSTAGKFDTQAAGSFDGSMNSITIGSGSDSATFYYKDTISGSAAVTATSTGLLGASRNFTIAGGAAARLAFVSAPQLISASAASSAIVVKVYDNFNNETKVASDTLITFGTTSSAANFSLAASPWNNISTYNLAAGQGAFTFFYKDQTIGSSVITLSSSLPAVSQTENIIDGTLQAGPPTKLLFQSSPKTGIINTGFDVNFFLANNSNQYVVAQGPINVSVTSSSGSGEFFDVSTNSWQNSITIAVASGESVKTLTYRDSTMGSPTITISATGLTSATQQENIINGVISKIDLVAANGLTTDRIPVTIKTRTSDDLPVAVTSDTGFALTQDGSGNFYRYATDTNPISSITIPAGNSELTLYYQQKVPGTVQLGADENPSQGWTQGQATIDIAAMGTNLIFTSNAQTKTAGIESDIMSVNLEDANGNIVAAPNDVTLHLSSSSAFGQFSLNNSSNWSALNAITLKSGSSGISFYYKDTEAGLQTVTVSDVSAPAENPDTGLVNATQIFHVAPAAVYSLNLLNSPQNLQFGQTSSALTVETRDQYGNVRPVDADLPIYFYSTSANGKFSSNGSFAGQDLITSTKIPAGLSNATFYYQDSLSGSPIITISDKNVLDNPDQGLLNAEQTFNVVPGAISKLIWETLPSQIDAGSSAAMVVKTTNAYGFELPVANDLAVYFSSNSGAGSFALDSNGLWNVTQAIIAKDASRITFYYKDTIVGTPYVVVSDVSSPAEVPDTGINNAAAYLNVAAGAITQIAFTSNPQVVIANHPSAAFQIQTKNASGVVTKTSQDTLLYLRSSSQGGEFSADGVTWGVNAIILNQNSSSATFYYRDWISGSPQITVSDALPITPDLGWTNAKQNITINAQITDHFTVRNISDPQVQGTPSSVVVSPVDAQGYVVKEYAGKITSFVAFDGNGNTENAMLPPVPYTFVPAIDRGVKTFTNGVAFYSTGEKDVRVSDENGKTGMQQNITVTSASTQPLAKIKFIDPTSPLSVAKNTASSLITIQMQDNSNNPVNASSSNYPVRIVATSDTAQISADGTNWSDKEIILNVPQYLSFATFYYRNTKSVYDTLTAMDWVSNVDDSAISNDTFDVTVAPGVANHFELTGNTAQIAGTSQTLTITAKDSSGDVTPSYSGNKQIMLSGADAALSGDKPTCRDDSGNDVNFGDSMTLNFVNGVATCKLKLYNAQTAQLNASDGTIDSLAKNAYSLLIDVAAAVLDAGNSTLNVVPSPQKVGASVLVSVSGKDKYLNVITNAADSLKLEVAGANTVTDQIMNFDSSSRAYQASYLASVAGTDLISAKIAADQIAHDTDGKDDGVFHEIIENSGIVVLPQECDYLDYSNKSSGDELIFDTCIKAGNDVSSNNLSKSESQNTLVRRLQLFASSGNSSNIEGEIKIKSFLNKPDNANFPKDLENTELYVPYIFLKSSSDSDSKMFAKTTLRMIITKKWLEINNVVNIFIVNDDGQVSDITKVESIADADIYEAKLDNFGGYYAIFGEKISLIAKKDDDKKNKEVVVAKIEEKNKDKQTTKEKDFSNDSVEKNAESEFLGFTKDDAINIAATVSTGIALASAAAASIPMLSQILGSMRAMSAVPYRRRQKWGIVYDSETGEPLSNVIVTIMDEEEKVKEMKNTDRFGFYSFLVKAGRYQIVVRKEGWEMVKDSDVVDFHTYYDNSYHAGQVIEAQDDEIISVNIPMQKSQETKIRKIFNRSVMLHAIFWCGFLFSVVSLVLHPSHWNAAILAFFVGNFLFTTYYQYMLRPGRVVLPSGVGVPFATVKIFDIANHELVVRTITNEHGNFVMILNEGDYELETNNGSIQKTQPLTMKKRQEVKEKIILT